MREVRIKDTLSGESAVIDTDGEVGIYACGPTVYSRIHIGNARPFVVFSLFARFLRAEGYATKLVVNVTDINDKIYAAAEKAGEASAGFAAPAWPPPISRTPTGSAWAARTPSRWPRRQSTGSSS